MYVFALVCPNGLGHFRRTVAVLDALAAERKDLDVTIAASAWQLDRVAGWGPAERMRTRARWLLGLVEPGVTWSRNPTLYGDGRLCEWVRRLNSVDELRRASLVLSDNLSGVLALRPDAVLLGSFLWSDVLEVHRGASPSVAAFVDQERLLLERCRPPMIAVDALAMPGVRSRTQVVGVGFMVEAQPNDREKSLGPKGAPKVAVLGGATGAADDLVSAICVELGEAGHRAGFEMVTQFGFGAADYAGLDLVVTRPGVGTLTSCVGAGVPMVLFDEGDNSELRHNAVSMVRLGVALDAGPRPLPSEVRERVEAALTPKEAAKLRDNLATLSKGGIEEAVRWLLSRLEGDEILGKAR